MALHSVWPWRIKDDPGCLTGHGFLRVPRRLGRLGRRYRLRSASAASRPDPRSGPREKVRADRRPDWPEVRWTETAPRSHPEEAPERAAGIDGVEQTARSVVRPDAGQHRRRGPAHPPGTRYRRLPDPAAHQRGRTGPDHRPGGPLRGGQTDDEPTGGEPGTARPGAARADPADGAGPWCRCPHRGSRSSPGSERYATSGCSGCWVNSATASCRSSIGCWAPFSAPSDLSRPCSGEQRSSLTSPAETASM